jgi:hypothetical protein
MINKSITFAIKQDEKGNTVTESGIILDKYRKGYYDMYLVADQEGNIHHVSPETVVSVEEETEA